MSSEIKLNPIGSIKVEKGHFYLAIKEKYRQSLEKLDGFSHINILWWGTLFDSPENRDILITEKPYKNGPDTIGIFATRSPVRPNPVLISIAAIINIDMGEGIIELPWIDAENDSPIIDIKPYLPCSDRIKNVRLPEWCAEWPQWYEDSATFDWSSVLNH